MFLTDQITGTLVNYYATCKREAWLYSRGIHADQEDDNIAMGRALSQLQNSEMKFPYSHLHFDKIEKQRGHYLITEYKKTLKNPEAAKAQLLFYLYILKNGLKLKECHGKIISGKTTLYVEGSLENLQKMEILLGEITAFINTQKPPSLVLTPWCRACGYRSYCF